MIQTNRDESARSDGVHLLRPLIPSGVWHHDAQDGHVDARSKADIVEPTEAIPPTMGRLGLCRRQHTRAADPTDRDEERGLIVTHLHGLVPEPETG
jgi:hypothetical protein